MKARKEPGLKTASSRDVPARSFFDWSFLYPYIWSFVRFQQRTDGNNKV